MRRTAWLVLLLPLAACGGSDERAGSPAVYSRIAATTDCAELQVEFDRAYDNNQRAASGSAEQDWTLGYMKAAEERRQELDC